MNREKNGTAKRFWIGLRCRNKDCNKDFIVDCDGEALVTEIPADGDMKEATSIVNAMLGRLSPILNSISVLHGAKPLTSEAANIESALQHCSHCGRWYFYPYSDYFLTMEETPRPSD